MCGPTTLQRNFAIGTLALAALAYPQASAWSAGQSNVPITVYAQVSPSAVLKFDFKATAIRVDTAAIARGYVDVSGSSYLSLNTGRVAPVVVLDFAPSERTFKSVEVHIQSGANARGVNFGGSKTSTDRVDALNYRFQLGERARPGLYFVPLTLNISM